MKIEKISENQLKFILTKDDLQDKDVKLEELSTHSSKAQSLFRDIMEQAMDEYDFSATNSPVMVEAASIADDGIMIIVTKIDATDNEFDNFRMFQQDDFNKQDPRKRFKRRSFNKTSYNASNKKIISIVSFSSIDDVFDGCSRCTTTETTESFLLKFEKKYYLIINYDMSTLEDIIDKNDLFLSEYGSKHIQSNLTTAYLREHGEIVIDSDAIGKLVKTFSV